MEPTEQILIGNLTESLNQSQRYIVIAFGASVFVLLLALGTTSDIKAPIGPADILVGKPIAIALSFAVFWVAALIASTYVSRIETIIDFIHDPDLVIASVTYPSILTTRNHYLRYGATLVPPALAVIALLKIYNYQLLGVLQILGILLLIAPHLSLFFDLREAVGESVRDERAIKMVCAKHKTSTGAAITTEQCSIIRNRERDTDTFLRVRTEDGDSYFLATHGREVVLKLTAEQVELFHLR